MILRPYKRVLKVGLWIYIAKPFNAQELTLRAQDHLVRKHVNDDRKTISIRDPLTQIYNRWHFDTIFEHFYSRSIIEDRALSFL